MIRKITWPLLVWRSRRLLFLLPVMQDHSTVLLQRASRI